MDSPHRHRHRHRQEAAATAAITQENTRFNRPRRKTDPVLIANSAEQLGSAERSANDSRRSIAWASSHSHSHPHSRSYSHQFPLRSSSVSLTPERPTERFQNNPNSGTTTTATTTTATAASSSSSSTLRPSASSNHSSIEYYSGQPRDFHAPSPSKSPLELISPPATTTTSTTSTTAIAPPSLSQPRIPRISFDFECQLPLRKRFLLSRAAAIQATAKKPLVSDNSAHINSSWPNYTDADAQQRDRFFVTSSRPVSTPHPSDVSAGISISSSSSSAHPIISPLSVPQKHRNSLLPIPDVHVDDSSTPDASKRRKHSSTDIEEENISMSSPVTLQTPSALPDRFNRSSSSSSHANGVNGRGPVMNGAESSIPDDGGYKSADIFLNIAKDSSRRNSVPRSEMKRVS